MTRTGDENNSSERQPNRLPTTGIRAACTALALLFVLTSLFSGCASLNPWKDDEYDRARNAIEGRYDNEGNWIRPEGSRADKRRSSELPKFIQNIPGLGQRPTNRELARAKYKEADDLFEAAKGLDGSERSKKFREAAKKYRDAGEDWVMSELDQNAYFMAAESYYFAEDYPKAENMYVKLIKEYPRNRWQDRVDQRRMEIGNYWLQFDDRFYNVNFTDNKRPWNDTENHGKRVMERMRLDNPVGRLADDVTMKLAETEFQRENWHQALDDYQELITTYPDSPFQFDAHFLGVKSALLAYQGPENSDEPLNHAEKLLKNMTRQFPDKCRTDENQELIRKAFAEVHYRKAERVFYDAQYRYRRSEAAASRIYCNRIIDEYGDTPFADKAKEMLAKMEGMDDVPTPYMSWMQTVFPTRDKVKHLLKPIEKVNEERSMEMSQGRSGVLATPGTGTIQR